MPVKITKKENKYSVETPNMVHAKGTTKEKAESQARLLRGIDHGWVPSKKASHADIHERIHKSNTTAK